MDQFDLLLCNGCVFTDGCTRSLDIGIHNGKISALASGLPKKSEKILDISGKLVLPGLIDAHTHMGIPIMDTFSADDFTSGSIAAACGGITTIFDFTVQNPGQTLSDSLHMRHEKAQGKCHVDYGFHVNITDQPEHSIEEIPQLIADGFPSYKVFSTYKMMVNWQQFRTVLHAVGQANGLLLLHAEDNDLVQNATARNIEARDFTPLQHASSRPPDAEASAIHEACKIAFDLELPLYIVHLSSKQGLHAALEARRKGCKVYIETCPQYLLLTEEYYQRDHGHYFITTPPLRTEEDSQALWQALSDGEIDVVATDHCPFSERQKNSGNGLFHRTPNGLPGVETLFPLMYTYGVSQGRISLKQMVQVLAYNPARIFKIYPNKGEIHLGADADLVIWDSSQTSTICARQLHGRADWSPYEGMKISGKLCYTILRGQIIADNASFVGKNVQGKLLRRKESP